MAATPRPPDLLVIVGPTAAGKTAAALHAAERWGGEIVSADAVQIYRGLDVGSAKPTAAERRAVPHHLIDVAEPTERYSAARFAEAAERAIAEIRGRGALPVVVGGCGLYVKALLHGLCPAPGADPELRERLLAEEAAEGPGHLHRRLAAVDPATAARLHPADRVRIVRALEVQVLTGRPMSAHHAEHGFRPLRHHAVIWGLDPGRDALRQRIDARVIRMVESGLVAEVAGLLARGVPRDSPGLRSPGYREMTAHLAGEIALPEAVRLVQRGHHRYARRQRTWFQKTPGVTWFPGPEAVPDGGDWRDPPRS